MNNSNNTIPECGISTVTDSVNNINKVILSSNEIEMIEVRTDKGTKIIVREK